MREARRKEADAGQGVGTADQQAGTARWRRAACTGIPGKKERHANKPNGPGAVNERTERGEERRRRRELRELQRRFREDDAPSRAARWRRYPALRRIERWMIAQREPDERLRRTTEAASRNKERYAKQMRERVGRIEERRAADRLPWPHTWKKRKRDEESIEGAGEARGGAVDSAATGGRSTVRAHVRRSSARPADFDYDQNPPKRARGGGRRGTKRKIEYIEDAAASYDT